MRRPGQPGRPFVVSSLPKGEIHKIHHLNGSVSSRYSSPISSHLTDFSVEQAIYSENKKRSGIFMRRRGPRRRFRERRPASRSLSAPPEDASSPVLNPSPEDVKAG